MPKTTPMMLDPRVSEHRAARAVASGMDSTPEARERYRQALGPYVECIAEHCPPHVRPHMMRSLFEDNIPLGVIAVAFKATDLELQPIRDLPPLNPAKQASLPSGYDPEVERLRRLPYREYLRTAHWEEVRLAALKRAEYQCSMCSARDRLEVHHRSYKTRGNEAPADVNVLCAACHGHHHSKPRMVA